MAMTDEQIERYSRHIILNEVGVKGQKKLFVHGYNIWLYQLISLNKYSAAVVAAFAPSDTAVTT